MATYTIWVDPVSGNDTNNGETFATAVKTNVGIHDIVESKSNNDVFIVNMVNTGEHVWGTTQFITGILDPVFTFRGVDSTGSPAWTVVHHEDGDGNFDTQSYLRLSSHAGVTIEYLDFDNTLAPGPSGFWAFISAFGFSSGDVLVHYCKINGGNTAGDDGDVATAIYPYYRTASSGVNTENQIFEFNLIQDAEGLIQAWISDALTFTFRRNVVSIIDSTETTWTIVSGSRFVFEYNTIVLISSDATLSYSPCITGVAGLNNGEDSPYPRLTIANNVIYKEISTTIGGTMSTSLQQIAQGSVGYDPTLESGSLIGYNFLYAGPAATAAGIASTKGYESNPFSPDDGTYYSTDLLTTGVGLADVFDDLNSTYEWTPQDGGSALTIEVPKDFRLRVNGSDGENDSTPGALPGLSQDYTLTVETSTTTPEPETNFDITVTLATSTRATSSNTITVTIPAGLSYQSHATTSGVYNSTTGEWTNVNVAAGSFRQLAITIQPDAAESLSRFTVSATITSAVPEPAEPTSDDTDSVEIVVAFDNGTDEANPVGCVEGIYDFTRISDRTRTQTVILCVSNNIYYDNGRRFLINAYDFLDWPAQYSFVPYDRKVYIASTNIKQQPLVFNGISKTVQTVGGAPNLGFWVEHYSRLIGGGDPSNLSFIYASATEDFSDWEAGSLASSPITLGITVDDGQRVTGISPSHYGRIYVFKNHSISVITGRWTDPLDVARSTISTTRGSINHHVIQQVGNDLLFWDEQGCHSLGTTEKFGDVETVSLSTKIRDAFRELVDFNQLSRAHSINYTPEDLYITWFPSRGSDTLDLAFVYNYSVREWTLWDLDARCAANVRTFEKEQLRLWTGTCDGFVQSYPGPQAYEECDMWTGGLLFGDPTTLKNYEEVNLYVTPSGDFDVDVELEFNADDLQALNTQTASLNLTPTTGRVLGELTLDSDTLSSENEVKFVSVDDFEGGTGRSAIVKVKNRSAAGNPLEVLGYYVRATRKAN